MKPDFDEVVAEMFRLIKPTTNASAFKNSLHPQMTDSCPKIPELEKIARGGGTLKQAIHRNACIHCQTCIATVRDILGIRPWWEELRAATALAMRGLNEMLVKAGTGNERQVKSNVLLPDYSLKPIPVNLEQCRFSGNGNLWMLLELEQPVKEIGNDSFELIVLADNGQNVFGPYLLPDLNSGRKERLLLPLPPALEQDWREKEIETTETVPFEFVLRPVAVEFQ
jgi:hypothetical protein